MRFEKLMRQWQAAQAMAREIVVQDWGFKDDSAVTNVIVAFIAVAIMLSVAVLILYNISTAMPRVESGPYNATQVAVETATTGGFNMIVVVLIILGAAGVMGAVALIRGRQ